MKNKLAQILILLSALGCHMEVPLAPVASFEFNPAQGCQAPCQVTFTSTSVNATSLEWDFDDGTKGAGNDPQTHEFKFGKKFYVKLLAKSSSGGSQGVTRIIEIKAPAASKPVAKFSYTFEKADVLPAKVIFSNQSENGTRYEWDFGDPDASATNPNTSTEQNPNHTYSKEGDYTVKLKTYNSDGVVNEIVAKVTVKLKAPLSKFTVTNAGCTASCKVTFTNNSENATAYEWDFGDGKKSTEQSPVHQYDQAGSFTVTLVVTNAAGVKNTSTQTVTIASGIFDAISIKSLSNIGTDIIVDGNSNVYVCGYSQGQTDFGNSIILTPSTTSADFYVAKYDKTGKCLWAQLSGSDGWDEANQIVLDGNNDVYIAGEVGNKPTASYASKTSYFGGESDGFVAKLNGNTGNIDWYKSFGGSDIDNCAALTFSQTAAGSRIYATGWVYGNGTANIDFNGRKYSAKAKDAFITVIDAATGDFGVPLFISGLGSQQGNSIAADKDGNAYLTGYFEQEVNFASGSAKPLKSTGGFDVFIIKWSIGTSTWEWAAKAGSSADDIGSDIIVDSNKNIYVTGQHNGSLIELGVGSAGDYNVFVGKWNGSGSIQWGRNGFNNGKGDLPGGLAFTKAGNVLVAGSFLQTGKFPFDNTNYVTSVGERDVIITEIDTSIGNAANGFQKSGGGSGNDDAGAVYVAPDGQIYVVGSFENQAVFNGVTLTGKSFNTFITKFK